MKILPSWLREFVTIPVDDTTLARDLTQTGINIEAISCEQGQTVFEAEITTNRPDAMNHYGVAREVAAIYDSELRPLTVDLRSAAPADGGRTGVGVTIEDAQGCARYTARIIRGIRIGPSPERMRRRLELLGSSSISNAVDASNYTLQEMGHPTHAFDLDKLAAGRIIVRRARGGEKLRTLDGVERKLEPEDLVIADAEKPVGLAGIMGGFDSMITPGTRNVLIESAWFDPVPIRKTARRLGMHTDASHRFERGADWGATSLACGRVAQLILDTAAGELEGDEIDVVARQVGGPIIKLWESEIRRILGGTTSDPEVPRILQRLGFRVTMSLDESGTYAVQVPTWRLDVEREIDLIEELARIYGYNRFPDTLPSFTGSVVELPDAKADATTRSTLIALGYNEAISLSFISEAAARQFSISEPAIVANPVSDEASAMRTSLVPGMLAMLERNLNRGNTTARLFEVGHAFELVGDRTEERPMLAIGATGNAMPQSVHQPAQPYGFFDLKGDIEGLLGKFEHTRVYFDAPSVCAPAWLRTGRWARIVVDGSTMGRFGEVETSGLGNLKLRQPVFVAELNLERLYRCGLRQIGFEEPSRYPAVERDFSFIFPDTVHFDQVSSAVEALNLSDLRSSTPVEIFRGGAIPAGSYSLLLRASFQSNERTLRDEEVAAWSAQIIRALEKLGGALRAQ